MNKLCTSSGEKHSSYLPVSDGYGYSGEKAPTNQVFSGAANFSSSQRLRKRNDCHSNVVIAFRLGDPIDIFNI